MEKKILGRRRSRASEITRRNKMNLEIITQEQIDSRNYWIDEISRLSDDSGVDAETVKDKIGQEIQEHGLDALLGHLRLCGAIPEKYGHDTRKEKFYSKYTDVVIHEAYLSMGFNSPRSCTQIDDRGRWKWFRYNESSLF